MKMTLALKYILTFILSLSLLSCGYAFEGGGSILPPDIKRVSIPLAEDSSTEPGLASLVTEAIRERFERFGVFTVVDTPGEADAVLYTRIINVKRETGTVTSETDTALQLDTVLTIGAELRRVSGPVLWREPGMAVSRSFGTTQGSVVATSPGFAEGNLGAGDLGALDTREISRGQEQQALRMLAEEAARRIYNSAVAPEF